ncbi:MAG: hypothetical protein MUO70_01050, partial [Euryarchaeota archaeon]|nr:hypothetical protein [Euryarchaeota archaeon]
ERPAFEGLDPDGRCIMKFDGETLTNREWAELLVHKYGDKEAAVWLASLKNIPAAPDVAFEDDESKHSLKTKWGNGEITPQN